jgi:hypothetical protein
MAANDTQVGGDHYKQGGEEHWDRVWRLKMNYWQAAATKYIERCYLKGKPGEDLRKARHYLDKLIELEEATQKEKDAKLEARDATTPRYRPVSSYDLFAPTGHPMPVEDGSQPGPGYVNQDR